MKSFRCWRLRASLVDFADGRLEERTRQALERHVAGCADCAATVLSLREVPAELRRLAAADPEERLWARQRAGIMRAIGDSQTAPLRGRSVVSSAVPWMRTAAVAASVVMIVLASQWSTDSSSSGRSELAGESSPADTVLASAAEIFPDEDWFETDEAALAISDTDDLDELGDFFEDAAI